jgi:hypothetical protein
MPNLVVGDASHCGAQGRRARSLALNDRDGRAERLVHPALDRVLEGDGLERAHTPAPHAWR